MAASATLCELFTRSVERCPENLAVDHQDGCLTYRELDEASSALAKHLRTLGVEEGSAVLLVTTHGSFNIIAILAILKSGACFVPIDRRTWSVEMTQYVCDTVDSPVIINTTAEPFTAPDGLRRRQHVLHLSSVPRGKECEMEQPSFSSPLSTTKPDDTACVIFTSGSTGRPKGVIVSHKSLCLYANTSPLNLDIAPGDRLLHILSVAFDACACMLFSALGGCGTIVPSQPEDIYNKASSCTVMAATPSIMSSLPTPMSEDSIFSNVHTIILGGETATPELLGSWVDAGVRVLVGYGVTETTSTGCIHSVERHPQTGEINPSLIGGYMQECPIWLLDDNLCAIEDDFLEGEIIISGDGVSQGYYEDEAKTMDAFMTWTDGTRVYRTGDYGRWVRGPAGDRLIEFRGRKDRTIKNRGFLVNLDKDVENGLYRVGASCGVTNVAAVATDSGIVAIVTPSCVDTALLLAKSEQTMSTYCLPCRIEAVEKIPLSSNGKVQYKKILDIIAEMDQTKDHLSTGDATTKRNGTNVQEEQGCDKLEMVLLAVAEALQWPAEKALPDDASFVALGGSSLSALKFVAVLRQLGLHLTVRDVFTCRSTAEIAQKAFNETRTQQQQATPWMTRDPTIALKFADLRNQARGALGLSDNSFDVGPLTSFQLDLAMPTLLDASKSVNQVKLVYGGSHASMMERAWRAVWQAEPVFRTEICLAIGCGAQIVHKKAFRTPRVEVYASRKDYETAVANASMAVGLGCKLEFFAYDPKASPPAEHIRRAGMTKGAQELAIVLTAHHSLIDGVSLKLLLDKIELLAQGRSLVHHCRPASASINASLGLMAIQKARDAEVRSFFATYLKNISPERTSTERHRVGSKTRTVVERSVSTIYFESSVTVDEVKAFASQSSVSSACIYYTAWAMAIGVLEGVSSVIVGAVCSNRAAQPDYEDAIGPFMSTLPLAVRLDAEELVTECLRRTMDDLSALGEYAWARADQVGAGRLIRNLLAMQLPLPDQNSKPPPIRVESLENSDFPLSLLVEANGNLRILYDISIVDARVVRRLGDHFKHAIYSLLHEARVEDCMRISQLQELVLRQAEAVRTHASNTTMKDALERSIDAFGENVALENCSGSKITYNELDRLTNMIAHHINATLPSDAGIVAVYGDGTTNWIMGLIGILKTGRVYAPLDPKWPMDRRAAVCEKSGAAAVLLPRSSQQFEAPTGLKTLAVDSILTADGASKSERLPNATCLHGPDSNLAIVFTSGTTGTPKGIPISNKGFLALQSNPEATMFAAPGRRIAQFMSPAFDYCNVEIFSALLHGATLVLRDPSDPYAHLQRVNTVTMTPSVLAVIDPNSFPNLEVIYATGEPVTTGLMKKFSTRSLFYNAYGPAECSICTSFTRMISGDAVTIGTAIDTARMYILDDEQNHAPDGVRGELYLAGVQVLKEYINAPDQTLMRILPDPWLAGKRMYRTGDYGMRGKDGRITYLGRIDRQVKIRGFRVELAGVENAIMSGPGSEDITQCAAFAVNGTLVACLAFDTPLHGRSSDARINLIKERLRDQLLPSWVPQVMFSVQQFPKTVNGKVDTGALEATYVDEMSAARRSVQQPDTSPSLNIEGKLAGEWRRVLQLGTETQFQHLDDFFSLGGHSVLIMLLSTRLSSIFGISVTARELLPTPSFRGQVEVIKRLLESKQNHTQSGAPTHSFAVAQANGMAHHTKEGLLLSEDLTELEKQVWFQYQVATRVTAFNIANVLHIRGRIDIPRLVEALNKALASDPVLRSNLVEGPNGPKRILRSAPPTARRVKRLNTNAEVNHRFDLKNDELIRVHLVLPRQEEEEEQAAHLVIVTSHSISDLGTLQNLLQIASSAYNSNRTPSSAVVQDGRPRHLDSSRWTSRPSVDEQRFWKEYLVGHGHRDNGSSTIIQRSFLPSPLATFQGASRTREFSGRLVTRVSTLMRRLGMTHHQMGLAAAALVLQWLSGENDIVLGAPNANRTSAVEREALGQFLDRLPIKMKLPAQGTEATAAGSSLRALLLHVRDSSRLALANAIPFSNILEALEFPGGALHHPLFECMVTFHPRSARLDQWLQLPDCSVSSTPMFAQGAKFPLMMEWFELGSDRWSLHMEHDTNYLFPSTVDIIEDALETILDAIGEECSLSELQARLADLELPDLDSLDDSFVSRSSRSPSPRSPRDSAETLNIEEIASTIQGEMAACLNCTDERMLSRSSSFFSAGADSAAVVSLRHRLQKLGFDVPVRAIFVAPSPLKLAEHVLVSKS